MQMKQTQLNTEARMKRSFKESPLKLTKSMTIIVYGRVTTPWIFPRTWVFKLDLGFFEDLGLFLTLLKSILSSGFNSNSDKVINYLPIY